MSRHKDGGLQMEHMDKALGRHFPDKWSSTWDRGLALFLSGGAGAEVPILGGSLPSAVEQVLDHTPAGPSVPLRACGPQRPWTPATSFREGL